MKICIITPVVIPILGKKQKYGGIEMVVALASEELVKRGHEVYLLAPGDSQTSAHLIPTVSKGIGQGISFSQEKRANRKAYRLALAQKPDVIWDHHLASHAQKLLAIIPGYVFRADIRLQKDELIDTGRVPVIHTLHGPAKDHLIQIVPVLAKAGHYFVSISQDQGRRYAPYTGNQHLGTVYNAINPHFYKVKEKKGGKYLIWLGRYGMEKGAHIAIEVARLVNMPIVLVGKLVEKHEWNYFNQFIKPKLRKDDRVYEMISLAKKAQLFRDAYAHLMTNLWPEPFGLVPVEVMATGTPVIAPALGSLPEVVGDTGVLVPVDDLKLNENATEFDETQKKYAKRIAQHLHIAGKISPSLPKERVEELFSPGHNANGYETAFAKAIYLKRLQTKALL